MTTRKKTTFHIFSVWNKSFCPNPKRLPTSWAVRVPTQTLKASKDRSEAIPRAPTPPVLTRLRRKRPRWRIDHKRSIRVALSFCTTTCSARRLSLDLLNLSTSKVLETSRVKSKESWPTIWWDLAKKITPTTPSWKLRRQVPVSRKKYPATCSRRLHRRQVQQLCLGRLIK